jgi:hypothetical protein
MAQAEIEKIFSRAPVITETYKLDDFSEIPSVTYGFNQVVQVNGVSADVVNVDSLQPLPLELPVKLPVLAPMILKFSDGAKLDLDSKGQLGFALPDKGSFSQQSLLCEARFAEAMVGNYQRQLDAYIQKDEAYNTLSAEDKKKQKKPLSPRINIDFGDLKGDELKKYQKHMLLRLAKEFCKKNDINHDSTEVKTFLESINCGQVRSIERLEIINLLSSTKVPEEEFLNAVQDVNSSDKITMVDSIISPPLEPIFHELMKPNLDDQALTEVADSYAINPELFIRKYEELAPRRTDELDNQFKMVVRWILEEKTLKENTLKKLKRVKYFCTEIHSKKYPQLKLFFDALMNPKLEGKDHEVIAKTLGISPGLFQEKYAALDHLRKKYNRTLLDAIFGRSTSLKTASEGSKYTLSFEDPEGPEGPGEDPSPAAGGGRPR